MISDDQIQTLREQWQPNPNRFFREILKCEPEPYQERINDAIAMYDRVAISACHDVGKSWDLARIVLWFNTCFPYSKVITTAPTHNQVKNILWAEIRAAHSKVKKTLGGEMNLTEWYLTPERDWFAIGFTPKNELSAEGGQGSASSFQGFHAKHMMIVFDEATGIPHNIWTMTEGMMTSGNVKFVAIGNPTSRNSKFYKCFSSPDWHKIYLSCFDSPNLIANGITDIDKLKAEIDIVRMLGDGEAQAHVSNYKVVKEHLITLKWVVSMALPRNWGVEHPLFVSKVLGKFPTDSDGTLIPLGGVEESFSRLYYPLETDRKIIGVDVARYGADATVLTALHGKKQIGLKKLNKRSVTEVSGEVIAWANELGPMDVIVIDETGVGGGVVDLLHEAKNTGGVFAKTEIRGVQFGARPQDDSDIDKFVNLKARMFKLLSDDLKSEDGLALIREDVYLDELPTILYKYDSKGKLLIESKDDYKKRTGRKSPDHADSLALANFGRYDEQTVGSFIQNQNETFPKPFAASLNSERSW